MTLLTVNDLQVQYGAIRALKGVSFEVDDGEIISLIGSNGAGKTTILHSLSGLVKKTAGTVIFDKKDITNTAPDKIVALGMVQSPEGRRIFANLTVKENLEMGAYTRRDDYSADMARVFEYFPRLKERIKQVAGTLSGGEQQMLAMGRALMAKPRLLLLDEPSMGLAPIFVDEIFAIIQEINKSGATILLVEQNAFKAHSIANRAYVLETGKIVQTGPAKELLNDDSVRKAYLGA
jgi:branched-chain amino acid transport system ATP-binding protein